MRCAGAKNPVRKGRKTGFRPINPFGPFVNRVNFPERTRPHFDAAEKSIAARRTRCSGSGWLNHPTSDFFARTAGGLGLEVVLPGMDYDASSDYGIHGASGAQGRGCEVQFGHSVPVRFQIGQISRMIRPQGSSRRAMKPAPARIEMASGCIRRVAIPQFMDMDGIIPIGLQTFELSLDA